MTAALSRRTLLQGAAATVLIGSGTLGARALLDAAPRTSSVARPPADLADGYARLRADLAANWFTLRGTPATGGRPGIVPTNGSGGPDTGTTAGVATVRDGALWQAAQYVKFLFADYRLRDRDPAVAHRIAQAFALLRAAYPREDRTHGFGSDGSGDGSIHVSDDAAWKLQLLQGVHEITGDRTVLADLRDAVIAINAMYRDTFNGGANIVANGVLPFSRYGMLYAVPGQDPNGQGRATTYEIGTLLAALHVYERGGGAAFLAYPRAVYAAFRAKLQHPSGIYYQTLQLDPERRFDGTPYLTPIDAHAAERPVQTYTGFTIGGTVAMAVLAARLYRATRDVRYRGDAIRIVDGIAREYARGGTIICDRDPWTAGFHFHDFVQDVMVLPGVDPSGSVRRAIIATGRRILATRTRLANGWGYTAEWSGNDRPTIVGRYATWAAYGATTNGGRGGGQAGPQQIMTQTSSGIAVQAAVALAA